MKSLLERFGEPITESYDSHGGGAILAPGTPVMVKRNGARVAGQVTSHMFGPGRPGGKKQRSQLWYKVSTAAGDIEVREEDVRATGAIAEDLTPGPINKPTCESCGGLMGMDESTCTQCGRMGTPPDMAEGKYGVATYEPDEDVCPTCNGGGFAPSNKPGNTKKCPKCGGSGEKPKRAKRAVKESDGPARHPGHAAGCTCPDCARPKADAKLTDESSSIVYGAEDFTSNMPAGTSHPKHKRSKVDEVAPPGGKKVVKALKKQKGVENPYAVAWNMKKHGEI